VQPVVDRLYAPEWIAARSWLALVHRLVRQHGTAGAPLQVAKLGTVTAEVIFHPPVVSGQFPDRKAWQPIATG